MIDILKELAWRGLINQLTRPAALKKRLKAGRIVLYAGFDPTAASLQVGNLLLLLGLRRFQQAGHQPIVLVGGATGLIGDPSGRSKERPLLPQKAVDEWSAKIRTQAERFLDFGSKVNPARLVNNDEWLGQLKLISFLRESGKHFSLRRMLAKETIQSRLKTTGISFAEFSYLILQAYDFLKLVQDFHCELQIGGGDQWGNITAGLELVKKVLNKQVYGLTFPLVTKAGGGKLGKTEQGTIWLDPAKTTPYQFYQFWLNTADQEVVRWLKYFTFLTESAVANLAETMRRPEKREAQRALARAVTTLVHGGEATALAEKISEALFSGTLQTLSVAELEEAAKDLPTMTLQNQKEVGLVDLLVTAQVTPSKRQAREDIQSGAILVNGQRWTDPEKRLALADCLAGKYLFIRRGKKNYSLVIWAA